jgi:acetoin utilization deacetylase AcuC-like enzyme
MSSSPMMIAYDPVYAHPLPEDHRFPMLKYELIPGQLLYEGVIRQEQLFSPQPCPDETILLTHDASYLQKLTDLTLSGSEQRRIGFPLTAELVKRERVITQGTIDCCHYAFDHGVSLNVAGGTHHAFTDRGEGFCLLNDFAVAAHSLLHNKKARKLLVVDLDVHQGNGTASIFSTDPRVFTFSMHGRNNYPFHKEKSDLDLELHDGIEGQEYLSLLARHLPGILEEVRPDLVFYLSGVDVLETDRFGKMKLTIEDCRLRDETVFRLLAKKSIPCVVAMGGGYSPAIQTIVEAHCNTFRAAWEWYGR